MTGPSFTSATSIRAPNTPVSTGTPSVAERFTELLVQRLGYLGPCRLREVGSSSLLVLAVGDQRELADDESSAGCVEERPVEAPGLVLEDAKTRDLAGQPLRLRRRVRGRDTQQHQDAWTDRRGDLTCNRDRRLSDALDDGSHAYSSASPSFDVRGRSERASLTWGVASSRRPWFTSARASA